jgi:8-oxo-dGTP diphosphatase
MNDSPRIPIFGEKLAGQTYAERPGAYALIRDARQRIAILRVEITFFLLGGGMASHETPQETLDREIMEECGRAIQIGPELGKAVEYIYARNESVYYQLYSTFFEARFMDGQVAPFENEHLLVWLSASEAIQKLQRQSQAWAVQQLASRTNGFAGASQQS